MQAKRGFDEDDEGQAAESGGPAIVPGEAEDEAEDQEARTVPHESFHL